MNIETDVQYAAWDKEAIVNKLREAVCEVTFLKTNGEQRVMRCTLDPSVLPQIEVTEDTVKRTKKENPDVLAVYDVVAQGWRSFRWDLLKDYKDVVA